MKNLKNEVINSKDGKMKAAFYRELEKQAEGRMKNASLSKNNKNKSRENETDSSEIKIESINGGLGAGMIDKKFNSYIGLESQKIQYGLKKTGKEN